MRIYHLALPSDWAAAREQGEYTTSSRGVTLAEEGFVHASTDAQWPAVRERFYADVTGPLLLLVIDPELLTSELRVEHVPEANDSFPHIYGPLNLDAVVEVRTL